MMGISIETAPSNSVTRDHHISRPPDFLLLLAFPLCDNDENNWLSADRSNEHE
ncbi:hypothetical protein GCM10023228_08760 [Brevibacillus fulvus]